MWRLLQNGACKLSESNEREIRTYLRGTLDAISSQLYRYECTYPPAREVNTEVNVSRADYILQRLHGHEFIPPSAISIFYLANVSGCLANVLRHPFRLVRHRESVAKMFPWEPTLHTLEVLFPFFSLVDKSRCRAFSLPFHGGSLVEFHKITARSFRRISFVGPGQRRWVSEL